MKKITLLCCFVFTLMAFSQSKGIISGTVSDENGLPLPGASVMIADLKTGANSDFDGKYTILNIPEGAHRVAVTYLGYTTLIKDITINNNSKTLNFTLKLATNKLNEIVLKGSMSQGQAKALNQQKANLNITNVVAADQVGKFPDANVGDALKRIPGISMQNDQGEARNIVIRGLAPQLNAVLLNGERIPSAEGDNRNVQLDLIPADMVQIIEVSKAVTSDMEADAIGGSVNLVTRSTPSEFRASVTGSIGENPVRNTPLYNVSALVAGRMFHNKLGAVLSTSYMSNDYGSDNIEFEWDGDFDNPTLSDQQIRRYDVRRDRKSISLNLDYKFNVKNTLFFKSIYNVRHDWEDRFRLRYKDIEEDEENPGTYLTEVSRQTKAGTEKNARLERQKVLNYSLKGEHILFNKATFDWKAYYSMALEKRPNERYITYNLEDYSVTQDISDTRFPMVVPSDSDYNDPSVFELDEISEENQYTEEENYGFKFDFEIPLKTTGENKNRLKVGYNFKNKEKQRDNEFNEYDDYNGVYEYMSSTNYEDKTLDGFLAGSQYQSGYFVSEEFLGDLVLDNTGIFERTAVLEEFVPQNYEAEEKVNAAYLMFTQEIGSKFIAVLGVRYEDTQIDYTGYRIDVEEAESIDDVIILSSSTSYSNFLPNVQLKYDINENSIVRLAYTNTIARPNYYDLVPYQLINSDDAEFAEGNPELEATKAVNFDLMYEKYFTNVGIFSAGVFYKDIEDWIYTYRQDNYTDPAFGDLEFEYEQPRNGTTASVFGFEVALQRKLNFLPGFLRNLNLYLNYTYTDAQGEIDERGEVPLAGAVENMFNGSLGYETDKLLIRASVNFADDYIDEYGGEAFEDRYYDSQLFLDINASYEFLKGLRLFTEFKNLTNQELRYYQGTQNLTMQAEWYDFNWNVGLKYNF